MRLSLLALASLVTLTVASSLGAASPSNFALGSPPNSASNAIHGDGSQGSVKCSIEAIDVVRVPGDITLIDVRASRDHEITWIPGAAHLSLVEVARSTLVDASDRVILIGSGKDREQLLIFCVAQQARGLHQLRVLTGGLPAWVGAGGAVAGSASKALEPLLLDPGELHALLLIRGRVPLIFTSATRSASPSFSGQKLVEAGTSTSPRTVLASLSPDSGRPGSFVVFLQTTDLVDEWRNAARAKGLTDPMFFIGDLSRYDTFLNTQVSIAQGLNKIQSSMCDLD